MKKWKIALSFMNRSLCKTVFVIFIVSQIPGCVSDKINDLGDFASYQQALAKKGPQERSAPIGLDSLKPVPEPSIPSLKETTDSTGKTVINLSLDDAVLRALAHSPEITIVSFDPSLAREDITRAVSEFDITSFGQLEYEKEDNPSDSIFQGGQSESSLWQAGIKQKGITGAEWSLAYALSRTTDDLLTSTISPKYEPAITFQIKQPLLRDAWPDLNQAGIKISTLNYRSALAAFRQKAEDVAAEVISLYWTLLQAQSDVVIQQSLLDNTIETLRKVENRKVVDATDVQIKQAETSVLSRKAVLLNTEQREREVQDALVRRLSDHQINLITELDIIPITTPDKERKEFDQTRLIERALKNNAVMQQAQLELEIADINISVAKRQKMPRVDLVASSRVQALSNSQGQASDMISDVDYNSYMIGVTFEYPLGNRDRNAVFRQRKLERLKAISTVQNISDQLAEQVRERIRIAETKYKEIDVQMKAVDASKIYLQAVENTETVREQLTPEFLLVKLQAQESLANALREEIKAIVDYNIALTRLEQTTGSVLDMRYVVTALPIISSLNDDDH